MASDVQARVEALLETAVQLLALEDHPTLARVLNEAHPADLADLLGRASDEEREAMFALIDEHLAAEVLAESDASTTAAIAEDLEPGALSDIVGEMSPDDAADLLGDLNKEDAAEVIGLLSRSEAKDVQALLEHEGDTGGGIMTPHTAVTHPDATVAEVVGRLRKEAEDEDVYALFVVDSQNRLLGQVPLRRLVTLRPDARVKDAMDEDVVTVSVDQDQEEIAKLFTRYNLLAAPVVDDDGHLVGQVTIDDIVDVIHEEASEDIYRMAGTSGSETDRPTPLRIARSRLPWLLICMVGSLLSSSVISLFQVTIEKLILLTVFIPVITATGGNSGLQASTVTVRGLVTGQVASGAFCRTILREIGGALMIGLTCGLSASGVAWLWFAQPLVGVCIGTAMFLVITVAVLVGVIVPMAFSRVGIDPAVASGPFITTTNDVVGLVIYLGMATLLIARMT